MIRRDIDEHAVKSCEKHVWEEKNYKNYICWHKTLQAHWIIWKIYTAVKEMIKQYWMLKKINVKLTKRNFFMDWANEIRFSNQRIEADQRQEKE